jgi:hypothetical protein
MGGGQIERSITDFIEPDDYDAQTPDGKSVLTDAQKAAIRSKASAEAAAKRKSVTSKQNHERIAPFVSVRNGSPKI